MIVEKEKENGTEEVDVYTDFASWARRERDQIRLHDRTNNGNTRVRKTRENTSTSSSTSGYSWDEEEDEQIWEEARRIFAGGEPFQVRETKKEIHSGGRDIESPGSDNGISRRENVELSTDISRDTGRTIPDGSNALRDISLGHGTNDLRGVHSSVRFRLTTDDFISRPQKIRFNDNLKAIALSKELASQNRLASDEKNINHGLTGH